MGIIDQVTIISGEKKNMRVENKHRADPWIRFISVLFLSEGDICNVY